MAPTGGRVLEVGWYLVSGRMEPPPGPVGLAHLSGGGETSAVPVGASGDILPGALMRLSTPCRTLLLMPPSHARQVPDPVLAVNPIGRARVLATMLAALPWRGMMRALGAVGLALLRADATGAARALHDRYLASVGASVAVGDAGFTLSIRSRPWPFPARPVSMRPAGDVARVPGGDEVWEALDNDPKFVASRDGLGHGLPAGWYRFRACLKTVEGQLEGPCLYPDYGDGESEGAVVPLGDPDPCGRIDLLVVLRQPARALRFDPTVRASRFRISHASLHRVSKPATLVMMLSRLRGERREALVELLRLLATRGPGAAVAELVRRYRGRNVDGRTSYSQWVKRFDTPTALDLERLRSRAERLAGGPRISLVVPVYQTPERWLRKCLDSVLAQVYPEWELCIADDASPSPHIRRVLAEYAARDPRIKVVHRERNGHISAASNSALALATGQYVGLLDHDDELRPHALLEVAETLERHPGLKVIYSDEDKIDEKGRRFDPYFKPDWNPDLLRSQNYLCHFSVLETALVREVGGFRLGYEGSQDHDLLLRCTERAGPDGVHHIPRVLYHWRAIAGSTALVRDAKDYAADAGARAVADHLVRIGADARVEQLPHGHYRVHWGLGHKPPKVSLVIPTRDRVDLLRTCVESLLAKTDYPDFEIVVVDNQSRDPETFAYFAELERDARTRVLRYDAPFNYSAINNWAVAQCDGALVGLLNNDIEAIGPGWLREMAGHALRPEIGAVGAMLYYPNDTIQHAGVVLGVGGVANHAYLGQPRGYPGHGGRAKVAQGLSAVTAACLLVRREAYERVGGLDETLEVAFNDVDFCLRLRAAGLQNLWTPFAEFYHHESASRGSEDTPEKAARFRGEVERMESRWCEQLYWDPAYNPNLSLFGTDFGFAFPPRVGKPPCRG